MAGFLIDVVGMGAAFFINAASYIPVIIALLLIRRHPRADRSGAFTRTGHVSQTLRYVGARPQLASALIVMTVAALSAYHWNVIVPTLTRDSLGGDARVVGFAFTSMGVGAMLGGLAM